MALESAYQICVTSVGKTSELEDMESVSQSCAFYIKVIVMVVQGSIAYLRT